MELSAILPLSGMGGESSRCLNDDFAAQTPSGDNIFNKPVADKTIFTTEFGTVTASFLFDPSQEFGNRSILASITTDFMSELRDALTNHLLDPKDIAPKKKPYTETLWDNIVANVPKETLAKNIFCDKKKLDEYLHTITSSVEVSYREEDTFTNVLQDSEYSFSFEVAVDHYPGKSAASKDNDSKCGVLTFHLNAKKKVEEKEEKKKAEKVEEKEEKKTEDGDNQKSKKRKFNSNDKETKKAKAKEMREEVLKENGLLESFASTVACVQDKKFPTTATQFFEQLGRWFNACVSNRASKLEKQRNRNTLYQ